MLMFLENEERVNNQIYDSRQKYADYGHCFDLHPSARLLRVCPMADLNQATLTGAVHKLLFIYWRTLILSVPEDRCRNPDRSKLAEFDNDASALPYFSESQASHRDTSMIASIPSLKYPIPVTTCPPIVRGLNQVKYRQTTLLPDPVLLPNDATEPYPESVGDRLEDL
jgi:hypothetical protein